MAKGKVAKRDWSEIISVMIGHELKGLNSSGNSLVFEFAGGAVYSLTGDGQPIVFECDEFTPGKFESADAVSCAWSGSVSIYECEISTSSGKCRFRAQRAYGDQAQSFRFAINRNPKITSLIQGKPRLLFRV